eukprot:gene3329-4174_t
MTQMGGINLENQVLSELLNEDNPDTGMGYKVPGPQGFLFYFNGQEPQITPSRTRTLSKPPTASVSSPTKDSGKREKEKSSHHSNKDSNHHHHHHSSSNHNHSTSKLKSSSSTVGRNKDSESSSAAGGEKQEGGPGTPVNQTPTKRKSVRPANRLQKNEEDRRKRKELKRTRAREKPLFVSTVEELPLECQKMIKKSKIPDDKIVTHFEILLPILRFRTGFNLKFKGHSSRAIGQSPETSNSTTSTTTSTSTTTTTTTTTNPNGMTTQIIATTTINGDENNTHLRVIHNQNNNNSNHEDDSDDGERLENAILPKGSADLIEKSGDVKKLYKNLKQIGSGGFGSVFLAKSTIDKCEIAIKKISHSQPKAQRTNLNEIGFLNFCKHPNIVSYLRSHLVDDQVWIAMEYMQGGTLTEAASGHSFNESCIAYVAKGMLEGLSYLHSHKFVHRDIKSGNIMMTIEGKIKIVDFGLCVDATDKHLSHMAGSPFWMSPEMIRGDGYSCPSDIWSFGICLLELANGEPPNRKSSLTAMFSTATGICPGLDRPEKWSESFKNFLSLCLEFNPQKRTTADQLLKENKISFSYKFDKDPRIKDKRFKIFGLKDNDEKSSIIDFEDSPSKLDPKWREITFKNFKEIKIINQIPKNRLTITPISIKEVTPKATSKKMIVGTSIKALQPLPGELMGSENAACLINNGEADRIDLLYHYCEDEEFSTALFDFKSPISNFVLVIASDKQIGNVKITAKDESKQVYDHNSLWMPITSGDIEHSDMFNKSSILNPITDTPNLRRVEHYKVWVVPTSTKSIEIEYLCIDVDFDVIFSIFKLQNDQADFEACNGPNPPSQILRPPTDESLEVEEPPITPPINPREVGPFPICDHGNLLRHYTCYSKVGNKTRFCDIEFNVKYNGRKKSGHQAWKVDVLNRSPKIIKDFKVYVSPQDYFATGLYSEDRHYILPALPANQFHSFNVLTDLSEDAPPYFSSPFCKIVNNLIYTRVDETEVEPASPQKYIYFNMQEPLVPICEPTFLNASTVDGQIIVNYPKADCPSCPQCPSIPPPPPCPPQQLFSAMKAPECPECPAPIICPNISCPSCPQCPSIPPPQTCPPPPQCPPIPPPQTCPPPPQCPPPPPPPQCPTNPPPPACPTCPPPPPPPQCPTIPPPPTCPPPTTCPNVTCPEIPPPPECPTIPPPPTCPPPVQCPNITCAECPTCPAQSPCPECPSPNPQFRNLPIVPRGIQPFRAFAQPTPSPIITRQPSTTNGTLRVIDENGDPIKGVPVHILTLFNGEATNYTTNDEGIPFDTSTIHSASPSFYAETPEGYEPTIEYPPLLHKYANTIVFQKIIPGAPFYIFGEIWQPMDPNYPILGAVSKFLPNITVYLYDKDGKELQSTLTDSKGYYRFNLTQPIEDATIRVPVGDRRPAPLPRRWGQSINYPDNQFRLNYFTAGSLNNEEQALVSAPFSASSNHFGPHLGFDYTPKSRPAKKKSMNINK